MGGSQFSPDCAVLSIKAVAAFPHFQISEGAGKCHSAQRVFQPAATKVLLHNNFSTIKACKALSGKSLSHSRWQDWGFKGVLVGE